MEALLAGTVSLSGLGVLFIVGIFLLLTGGQSAESANAIRHDNNPISRGIHFSDVLIGIVLIVIILGVFGQFLTAPPCIPGRTDNQVCYTESER